MKKCHAGPKPVDSPLRAPGSSVQFDVKFVPRIGPARQRFDRFTASEEAALFRVLHIHDHNNAKTTVEFLSELRGHFPFAI